MSLNIQPFDPKASPLSSLSIKKLPVPKPKIQDVVHSTLNALQQLEENPELPTIDHCPMSDEMIKRESLLERLELDPIPDLCVGKSQDNEFLHFVANFLGGGLITGGNDELDGMQFLSNFIGWKWLLKNIESSITDKNSAEKKMLDDLLQGIRQLEEYATDLDALQKEQSNEKKLEECALKYTQYVQNLAPGESRLFCGGWETLGEGGHAQIYEFRRNKDQTFDIFLYTSTHFQLADTRTESDKTKIKPVICFSGVPEEKICFNEDGKLRPAFIQHIIENSILSKWEHHVVDEEDVLETFDHLLGYWVRMRWDEEGAITGQRAGTCVPSSTKVWARHACHHLGRYKQLMLQMNLRLIVAAYRAFKSQLSAETKEGALKRHLLELVGRNFLRGLSKSVEGVHGFGPLAHEEMAIKSQATIYHLLKEVAGFEKALEKERSEKKVSCDLSKLSTERQRENRKYNPGVSSTSKIKIRGPLAEKVPELKTNIDSFKALHSEVSQLRGLQQNKELLNLKIHDLVDSLPLPKPPPKDINKEPWIEHVSASFLEKGSLEEMEIAQEDIIEIAIFYMLGSRLDQHTRCQATVFALQALTHFLALKIEAKKELSKKARMSNYELPKFWNFSNRFDGLIYFDRNEYLRIQEAIQYFEAFNSQAKYPPLFDFDTEKIIEVEVIRYKLTEEEEEKVRGNFWEALIQDNASIRETLDQIAEKEELYTYKVLKKEYEENWEAYALKLEEYDKWLKYSSLSEGEKKKWRGNVPSHAQEPQEPVKPIEPIKSTLRTLYLESNAHEQVLFAKTGISYVSYTKYMTEWAQLWMKKTHIERFNCFYNYNFYSPKQNVSKTYVPLSSKDLYPKVFQSQHPQLKKEEHFRFFLQDQNQRNMLKWGRPCAEAKSLQPIGDPLLDKLHRIASEWKLTPSQIIFELNQHLDSLGDASLQALVFRLFFRSPVNPKNKALLGIGELIVKDKALLNQCKKFINEGLIHFYKAKDKEGGNGAFFFFYLSFFLSKYLADAGEYEKLIELDTVNFIDRWLGAKDVEKVDISMLHHYRLLFESLKLQVEFTDETVLRIYQSWILHQFYPGKGKRRYPILNSIARESIARLTIKISERLQEDKKFRNQLAKTLLTSLSLVNEESNIHCIYEKNAPNLLKVQLENKEKWKIDLLEGSIFGPRGRVGNSRRAYSWTEEIDFRFLFGNSSFDYVSLGDSDFSFEHPQMGTVRLIERANYKPYAIQRQFPGIPGWFEYQPKKELAGFPNLFSEYAYWAPITGEKILFKNSPEITGFLAALHDHKIQFATTSEGVVMEVKPETGKPSKNSSVIDYPEEKSFEALVGLSKFDESKNILCYRKGDETLHKIVFPRYTLEGNTLEFVIKDDKALWSENTQYAIHEKKGTGALGMLSSCISLAPLNKKGPCKLLVPFQPVLNPFSLDIDNRLPLIQEPGHNLLDSWRKDAQWGKFQYFVFNVENGKVKPTTLEGRLFLAYIYFSQKKYAKAIKLLRSIKPTETLTDVGKKVLKMILEHPLEEDHPDAKMVHMHTLLCRIKQMDKVSSTPVKTYFEEGDDSLILKLMKSVSAYLGSLNNISSGCRLTIEEESELLHKLVHEVSNKKLDLIKPLILKIQNTVPQLKYRLKYLEGSKKGKREATHSYNVRELPASAPSRFRHPFTERKGMVYLLDFPYLICPSIPRRNEFNGQESFEKALVMYQAERKSKELKYNQELRKSMSWLSRGTTSRYVTRPNKKIEIDKNGTLLLEVLNIAKNESVQARKEMLYRLQQWRIHLTDEKQLPFIDLMRASLCQPEHFPTPLDPNTTSDSEKKAFIKDIYRAYVYNIQLDNKKIDDFLKSPTSCHMRETQPPGNYPILGEDLFDVKEKKVEEIAPNLLPVEIEIDENKERWSTLDQWKQKWLKEVKKEETNAYKDFNFKYTENLLDENEKDFALSLENDLKLLQADYDKGKAQNEKEIQWNISQEDCSQFLQEIGAQIKEVKKKLATKKTDLIAKANTKSSDPLIKQGQSARIGGMVEKPVTYADCVNALLARDRREYLILNPNLQEREIEEIAHLTLEVEDLKSYQAQLGRLEEICGKIKEFENPEDLTRQYLCRQLHANLEARYLFNDFDREIQIAFRVFAAETGILPYQKQISLIKKMLRMDEEEPDRFKDIVGQLIMGGGKTSVVATLILYLAAKRPGRLSLFIVPSSLLKTVEANLSEAMWKAFHKRVQSIDVTRKDLVSVHKLTQIANQLEKAKERQEPIIMTASTLQCFELEFISTSRKLRENILERRKAEAKKRENDEKLKSLKNDLFDFNIPKLQEIRYQEELKQNQRLDEQLTQTIKNTKDSISDRKTRALLLSRICRHFSKNADALLDEVDLLLDSLKEVNFPDGDTVPIEPNTNTLLHNIYKILVSDELKEIVRLQENKQTLMDPKKYREIVMPTIAKELAKTFHPFRGYVANFVDSFSDYVSGKMPAYLQKFVDDESLVLSEQDLKEKFSNYGNLSKIEQDIAFLRSLKNLFEKGSKVQKEAANLIALTKHILCDVLPCTLNKSGRRHYGPPLSSDSKDEIDTSDIVPYLGVLTPAKTQFGYHLEKACYFYQWSAAFPLTEKDVLRMVDMIDKSAQYYMERNGETFEETVEFKEFSRLSGVRLDEVKKPEFLKKATENLSADVKKRLDFQYEVVATKTASHVTRLSSTGCNFYRQSRSNRTMTGTPSNWQGYPRRLTKGYEPDDGTEGKILHTLAKRAQNGKIHEVDFSTIEEFLDQIVEKHPTPHKIRGIIEAGGVFKHFNNNAEVAKNIMDYISKCEKRADHKKGYFGEGVKGVLFFHKDPGQQQADTLYVWKEGASQPERIGSTSKEALKAKGLDPSQYFVYYDERHTTGIDIVQPPDAINLLPFDEKMDLRTVLQATMRLRQYLFSQNVEFVVTKAARALLVGQGKTLEDFMLSAKKTQSLRNTGHLIGDFKKQINDIFRSHAVDSLMTTLEKFVASADEKEENDFLETSEWSEPFVVSKMGGHFYSLHGRLELKKDTKENLLRMLKNRLTLFEGLVRDERIIKTVREEVALLEQHIKATSSFPAKSGDIPELGVEVEQEVEVQVQVQTELKHDTEVEKELNMELKGYEMAAGSDLKREKKIDEKAFLELIKNVRDDTIVNSAVIPLQTQLQKIKYGLQEEPKLYHKIFKEPIYGTSEYFYPTKDLLPIFHPQNRPPKQILAIKVRDHRIRWVLLSEFQANAARKHLLNLSQKGDNTVQGVWLIQPDGSELVDTTEEFPIEEEDVEKGLFELNVLGGKASYLDQHTSDFEIWLSGEKELKIRFLKLRTARDKKQNDILRCNPLILEGDATAQFNHHVFKARVEKEKLRRGKFIPEKIEDVKNLSPKLVNNLHIDYVQYLGSDDNEELTRQQFEQLRPFQIPYLKPFQMKWLPVRKIQYVKHAHQICSIEKNIPSYFLSLEQVKALQEHQTDLIFSVNPEFYKDFDAVWQIEAVPVEHVDKLLKTQWVHLTKMQVKNLKPQTETDLESLRVPQKYSWVHGNFLDKIPKQFLGLVCKEQIQEITDTKIIKKLEELAASNSGIRQVDEGKWSSWIKPEMVPHIRESQVKYLDTQSQIINVSNQRVPLLVPKRQVPLIVASQVKYLEGIEQIQACPYKFVKNLDSKSQVPSISFDQVPHLIGQKQIKALDSEQMFSYLTAEQMVWVTEPQQFQWVTFDQVSGLNNEQLLKLKEYKSKEEWSKVQGGIAKAQIDSFDTQELIDLLTPSQIKKNLSKKSQVCFLKKEWQIQACPCGLIQELDPISQVPHIRKEQVQHLSKIEQIRSVAPEFYPELVKTQVKQLQPEDMNIIDALSEDQLVWRSNEDQKKSKIRKFGKAHPHYTKCVQITTLALGILSAAVLLAGLFALMGGYSSFAPQFMISLYKGIGSPLVTYALMGGGGCLLLGLVAYAIQHSRTPPYFIVKQCS